MKIMDCVIIAAILLWLAGVIIFLYKKKKSGACIGCSGGSCSICNKKRQK